MAYGVLTFTEYQSLIRTMRQINPELVRALRKRYRQIARPVVSGIKGNIPSTAPLSGMVTKVGRLSWSRTMNQSKDVKSVVIRERRKAPRTSIPIVGIVQARAVAAPLALADMSGRSGAHINARSVTREYDYTYHKANGQTYIGKRKHRINGQGRIMIARLASKASRYVYPGAERALPEAKIQMEAAVNDAVQQINQMLRRA